MTTDPSSPPHPSNPSTEEPRARLHETRLHGRSWTVTAARSPAPWLIGFHGYGENGTRHLSELRRIPGVEGWNLCAIEALHRFYNTRTGEVVGSWMTKEDREQAIADNLTYVDGVLDALMVDGGAAAPPVFAGFSQGVAMAYRAAARSRHGCAGLIVLAGDVPPDVADDHGAMPSSLLLGRGTADSWYTEDKMTADQAVLAACGTTVETCVFEDGHVWNEAFHRAAGDYLTRILAGGRTGIAERAPSPAS